MARSQRKRGRSEREHDHAVRRRDQDGSGEPRADTASTVLDLQRKAGNKAVEDAFDRPTAGAQALLPAVHVQREVETLTPLTSIRMADSPRLQNAARNSPPLKRGDPDKDAVARVQETLIDAGFALPGSQKKLTFGPDAPASTYSEQGVDGIFGKETKATVAAFQRNHKLSDDGIVGKDTMTALDGVAARRNPSDQPLAGPLAEGEKQRKYSRAEYIEMWEKKHGRRMTGEERHSLAHGCIGITALNLQGGGSPPLGLSFSTFAKAQSVAGALNRILGASTQLDQITPEVLAAAPELLDLKNVVESLPTKGSADQYKAVIFSKRFFSNQSENWHDRIEGDDEAFLPDKETGQVDMSSYKYEPKSRPELGEGRTFVNFDYGWWDDETNTWWHANHAEEGMEVYQSTLEHYSRPLRDFDRQVFSVAFARRI